MTVFVSVINHRLAAALLAFTLLIGAGYRVAPAASAAGDCTVDAAMDSEEQAFLTLINDYRAQNGLGALKVSYMLTKASACCTWAANTGTPPIREYSRIIPVNRSRRPAPRRRPSRRRPCSS